MSVGPSPERKVEELSDSIEKGMNPQDGINILMVDDQPGKLLSYEARQHLPRRRSRNY
jgi:hypothetical protein